MIGQLGDQAEAAAVRGLARIDRHQQAPGRMRREKLARGAALLAAVEAAAVVPVAHWRRIRRGRRPAHVCGRRSCIEDVRPRQIVAEFERHRDRAAVATGDRRVPPRPRHRRRLGVAHADAFAVGHQQRAQAGITRARQIERQPARAAPPHQHTEQREHEPRQHAVDHDRAHQPARPGAPAGLVEHRRVTARRHRGRVRHRKAEHARQCAKRGAERNEGIGRQDRGLPHEAVAPGGEQRENAERGAEQRRAPQRVVGRAHAPRRQPPAPEQATERQRQVGGGLAAIQETGQRQPRPAEHAAVLEAAARATLQRQRHQPQQKAEQMHAKQPAQRPHHIHRPRAVAQHAGRRAETQHQRQHRRGQQQHARPRLPAQDRFAPALARTERISPMKQPVLEIGRCSTRISVDARVVERTVVFLMAAHQFGEPAGLEWSQIGRGAQRVSSQGCL